jgi:hypothetical protein
MNPPSLEKLAAIERSLSRERGKFDFFGLVLREDITFESWDLAVAAPWLEAGSLESLRVIGDALRATMTSAEMVRFSFYVIVEPDSPFLKDVLTLVPPVEHGLVELADVTIGGMDIRKAYIFTAKGPLAPKPKARAKKPRRTPAK